MAPSDTLYFDLKLTLRILIVTDGAINLWDTPLEPDPPPNTGFTLREMSRALWDAPTSLYPYTEFVVDHAIHGIGTFKKTVRAEVDRESLPTKTRKWTQYDFFRFDDQKELVQRYDQLWLFGYWPGNPLPRTTIEYRVPASRTSLNSDELRVISDFMDGGGGVFATGDHGFLGEYLCGSIPRVGRMRRWRDHVPSVDLSDRIDTIVPVRSVNGVLQVVFDDQSDDTPKPLVLKRYFLWNGLRHAQQLSRTFFIEITRSTPHPILCSPWGAIDSLPDHMHEGLLYEDDEVELDHLYEGKKEFPGGANRPTPEVIAWSTVRGGEVQYDDRASTGMVVGRTAPSVSVYDGQQVKIGRIVVDSTFHHWLDINLRAVGAGPQYTGLLGRHLDLVHNYIRNIAQWLATPIQRQSMRDGLFVHVVANTGGWSGLINKTLLIGEHAANVLGQTVSVCEQDAMVFEQWFHDTTTAASAGGGPGKFALPAKEFVHYHVLGTMTEKAFEIIRRLPTRTTSTKASPRTKDSIKEFEFIAAELHVARKEGVRGMCAEWRQSLESTARFLNAVEDTVGRPRPAANRITRTSRTMKSD